jgi:hypothetical protein
VISLELNCEIENGELLVEGILKSGTNNRRSNGRNSSETISTRNIKSRLSLAYICF